MSSVLLRHVATVSGEDAVGQLLRRAGSTRSAAFLEDPANWISYDEAIALFEAAAVLTDDPQVARRVGEQTVRQHAGTPVATVLRALGSPEAVMSQISVTVTKFSTVTAMEPVEVAPGRAVVRAFARPGFKRHRHLCDWTGGMLSQPTALFGLPPAVVEESQCQVDGALHCLYTISWDAVLAEAAADPHQLVTALEAQLVAIGERLDNVYATAGDLMSHDDLDGALGRITDRAATAVRAPRYLLAVQMAAGDRLRVHHLGFPEGEAMDAAKTLLHGELDDRDGSCLVAEVRSPRRHYGRLMAVYPTQQSFFDHERDLFEVYARYAAAVLDTATAFAAAERQHDQAVALLELSRAVAAAVTSEEVAWRLAEAVPAVVDCDRTSVFVWLDSEQQLVCKAVYGDGEEREKQLPEIRIAPSDTAPLAAMLASPDPQPMFLRPDSDDALVREFFEKFGGEAVVCVPIAARGEFFGVLIAGVTSDPNRLRPSSELLDRLAGVVAHSATALANARLFDRITREARHDSLTGLLGHRALQETLELLAEREEEERFSLAIVDIDDFKRVNDTHGHQAGDYALCRVAEALQRNVRDQDAVFRVGGEEFCVVMPGLERTDAVDVAERLRLAVADTDFQLPLRVSIGVANYPADAATRETLLARADAALYSAKRSGKNRTTSSNEVGPAAQQTAH
jgi:diguanylate cyclase (GGDEF)-like protein